VPRVLATPVALNECGVESFCIGVRRGLADPIERGPIRHDGLPHHKRRTGRGFQTVKTALRTEAFALGMVVLLALLLRVGVVLHYEAWLLEDRDAYLGIARSLAEGRGYSVPGSDQPTAYRPPLYPLLLAGLLCLGASPLVLGLANVVLGTAAVAMTGWTARRWLGPVPACIAALVVALEPLGLANTALLMTETIATTLLASWLFALSVFTGATGTSEDSDRTRSPRRNRLALATGFLAGLATLCRPILLPTVVLGWAWLVLVGPRRDVLAARVRPLDRLPMTLMFCVGLALTVGPWTVRNWVQLGTPIVTTTHGGYTLLLGHNASYSAEVVHGPPGAVWSGESLTAWQRSVDAHLKSEGIQPHEELRRDRAMSALAWKTIAGDLPEALRSGWSLLSRLWGLAPASTVDRPISRPVVVLIATFNGCLFLMAAIGLLELIRSHVVVAGLLASPLVVFTLMHSLYWADQRMRAPLVPVLAILAARGVTVSMDMFRRRGTS
jgi:hypothetical protein